MGNPIEYPNRLRALRQAQGVSREQIAVEYDVGAAAVEYWERVNIPSQRLVPLAQRFGVTVDYLLGADEPEEVAA